MCLSSKCSIIYSRCSIAGGQLVLRVWLNSLRAWVKEYTFGISKRIFLSISILGFILILALSISIYGIVNSYLKKQKNQYVYKLTQQVNNSIDTYLEEMEKALRTIAMDKNVVYFYNHSQKTNYERDSGIMNFIMNAQNIINAKKYNDFYFFIGDSKYIYSSIPQENSINFSKYEVETKDWYKKIINSSFNLEIINNFHTLKDPDGENMFAYSYRFQPYSIWKDTFMLITSKMSFFTDLLRNTDLDPLDFVIICDEEGNIIYNSKSELLQNFIMDKSDISIIINDNKSIQSKHLGKENYLVTLNTSSKTKWNIISFTSEKNLNRNVMLMNLMVYVITLCFIIVQLLLSYFISTGITSPIKKLSLLMKDAENKNYFVEANIKNNDEIGELGNSFNIMIKRLVENQILRKEAEIEALQQQINPHFFYNTLETINSLAVNYGCSDINTITEKLGDMFRYSLDRNKDGYVTIEQELEHVKCYISIMSIRFKGKFDVQYLVEDEVLGMKTLKFILQPIIENIIHHGFEGVKSGGIIKISSKIENGCLLLRINDNGIGMNQDRVNEINFSLTQNIYESNNSSHKSIGLKNVHNRISLVHGYPFGIQVFSEWKVGTEVLLTLPVVTDSNNEVSI